MHLLGNARDRGRSDRTPHRIPAGNSARRGDLAYPNGTPSDFLRCYEPTWGRFKDRTRPTPGNHDYHWPGAPGYYSYWGVRQALLVKASTVSMSARGTSSP
jgi:hypothetical protein